MRERRGKACRRKLKISPAAEKKKERKPTGRPNDTSPILSPLIYRLSGHSLVCTALFVPASYSHYSLQFVDSTHVANCSLSPHFSSTPGLSYSCLLLLICLVTSLAFAQILSESRSMFLRPVSFQPIYDTNAPRG